MGDHTSPDPLIERWRETNPVRLVQYPVVVAVVALLVWYGVIAAEAAPLWLALAAAVLSAAGIEVARAQVNSPATARELEREAYAHGVKDALRATPDTTARQQGGAVT